MAYVDEAGAAPWRVSVEQPAVLPPAWHRPASHEWHWMLTTRPARRRVSRGVEVLTAADAAAVDELLDAANPHSFARPGVPGVAAWLGIRDGERLLAAGALQRMHDGTLHLRGVGVRPEARGQGLGTALSAALTDHALLHGSGVATLGVYSDNAAALAVYSRLGYRVAVTFTSGEVGVRT
jgi:GNAT superfamily N-acetyltransferase